MDPSETLGELNYCLPYLLTFIILKCVCVHLKPIPCTRTGCVKPSLNCNVPVSSFVIMFLCCYKYTFYSLYPVFYLMHIILVWILEYHAWASLHTTQWLQQTIKLIEFWCLICSNANPKSSQGKGCHEFLATFITTFIRTSQYPNQKISTSVSHLFLVPLTFPDSFLAAHTCCCSSLACCEQSAVKLRTGTLNPHKLSWTSVKWGPHEKARWKIFIGLVFYESSLHCHTEQA